jgi:hypothetical protein
MVLFWKKSHSDSIETPVAGKQSFLERMRNSGEELMTVVGPEDGSCNCGDWVGAVVSISGNSKEWPALESAIDDGVFHENCRHGLLPYTGENKVEAEFCSQLAVKAMESRKTTGTPAPATLSPSIARQLEFAKLYNLVQQADSSGAIETTYAKCKAAMKMLEDEDIFGDEQAQVEQVLEARIRAIEAILDPS